MPTWAIVLIIIAAAMVAAIIILWRLGKKAEKRKAEQDEIIKQTAQSVSLLVIDKKKMRLKDSGLPPQAIAQAGRIAKNAKLPIVKAKVGPKIAIFISDEKVFDLIPLKKEIKAEVSGLYIVGVKGIRGSLEKPEPKKKGIKGLLDRAKKRAAG